MSVEGYTYYVGYPTLPLTDMRYINGWVESLLLTRMQYINGGQCTLFYSERVHFFWRIMEQHGFYIVSDRFFEDFPDPYLKGNKKQNRPHYYAFKDEATGLFWMIPMSSKVEKYEKIIENKKAKNKPCDILHIAKLDNDKKSVFVIQDMFPITDDYIERIYTLGNNHFRVTSEHLSKTIDKKARKVLKLIRNGVKFSNTSPNVLFIEHSLISNQRQQHDK